MPAYYTDSRSFKGLPLLSSAENLDPSGASYVQSVTGNELRLGKNCMIHGFPCKIRGMHWAKTGKHGHAKLRIVGVGIFDGKRRETIFVAQNPVLVPSVETQAELLCITRADGFHLVEQNAGQKLPPILPFPDENDLKPESVLPKEGEHVNLTIVTALGHFKIASIRMVSQSALTGTSDQVGAQAEQDLQRSAVLSKKDMRKQRKLMRKQQQSETTTASLGLLKGER